MQRESPWQFGETVANIDTMRIFVPLLLATQLLAPADADARSPREIRIATWNIEWLHEATDQGTVKRSKADYKRLQRYAKSLRADVIALQEVRSAKAVRRVFDPREYVVYVTSARRAQRVGFAVRRSLTPFKIHEDMMTLNVGGLRAGADITITFHGKRLRLLAVHLKSGCWGGDLARQGKACRKLRKQLPVLEKWIDARASEPIPFAVLGDFNRRFARGEAFWQEIDDGEPPNADLSRVTEGRRNNCWGGKYPQFIDHIVLDKRASRWVVRRSFREHLFDKRHKRYRKVLSDHCAISVALRP